MRVAGLDLASRSGFAVLDGDRLVHAESFRPATSHEGKFFTAFRQWLGSMLVTYQVEHAAIEQPLRSDLRKREADGTEKAFSNMATFRRLYGLAAHAIEVCSRLDIPCEEVNQSTWRKAFVGNGRASKEDSVQQCRILRWNVTQKDAAEACGVAWWLAGHVRGSRLSRPDELFARSA
jgi:Holliday junction resolvasome RuvABC endonuclease subunit